MGICLTYHLEALTSLRACGWRSRYYRLLACLADRLVSEGRRGANGPRFCFGPISFHARFSVIASTASGWTCYDRLWHNKLPTEDNKRVRSGNVQGNNCSTGPQSVLASGEPCGCSHQWLRVLIGLRLHWPITSKYVCTRRPPPPLA